MLRLIPAATFLFLLSCCVAPGQAPAEGPDTRQVHWQRSLDDALALCKATGRPLLIAVNMDGESASDRIVHENYRDPAFVASTRRCVCLGASVFRHNARDHDDQGRRIPCPRLGDITCGEHMALEPILFAKYLSDGDRVAPRHALILPEGKKAFDISLSFDLLDIDRALASAVAPARSVPAIRPPQVQIEPDTSWASLTRGRDHRERAQLETALAQVSDEATLGAALAAIAERGDAGSIDALRLVGVRLHEFSPALQEQFCHAAQKLSAFAMVQDLYQTQGVPGGLGSEERRTPLRSCMLAMREKATPVQQSFLLATHAVGRVAADLPVRNQLDPRLKSVLDSLGGPVSIEALLHSASVVTRSDAALPRPGGPTDEMPEASVIHKELEALDNEPNVGRSEPEWLGRFAKASLDLGRRHQETAQRDTQLLFEDAAKNFAKALEQRPDRYDWWIERARTAYFLGRFAEEVEYGRKALASVRGTDRLPADADLVESPVLQDARSIEALRWIGDGNARLLGDRAGKDPAVELGGMVSAIRSCGVAAVSPFGYEKDWLGFASACGAVELQREELAILLCGVMRLPAARELRQALNTALWRYGRPDLAPVVAEQIARAHPGSADACWFTGYAWIVSAEDARRCERPRAAIADYHAADDWFQRAAALKSDYADNCRYMRAVVRCGEAMARAQARPDTGERNGAAGCLAQAVQLHGDLSQVRDGLGYDVLDLIDKILEWRADGAPVGRLWLLTNLDPAALADPFWAAAVSDSLLREALRADGRNPERKQRETVDAAGKRITMMMGVPNEEGDRWLQDSILAGREASRRAKTDADRLPLAQAQTIWAERMLERGRTDGVHDALTEAAGLMKVDPPAAGADQAALTAVAAKLRSLLGEARPRLREGR